MYIFKLLTFTFKLILLEYGSEGKVSTKGDVYSYGIVLLETLTGRRPTAEIFDGGQSLRLWVMESLPNNIMEVVDDCMMGLEGNMKKCLASILEVALECSHELPEQRIDMKEVVVRLNRIKLELSRSGDA